MLVTTAFCVDAQQAFNPRGCFGFEFEIELREGRVASCTDFLYLESKRHSLSLLLNRGPSSSKRPMLERSSTGPLKHRPRSSTAAGGRKN